MPKFLLLPKKNYGRIFSKKRVRSIRAPEKKTLDLGEVLKTQKKFVDDSDKNAKVESPLDFSHELSRIVRKMEKKF